MTYKLEKINDLLAKIEINFTKADELINFINEQSVRSAFLWSNGGTYLVDSIFKKQGQWFTTRHNEEQKVNLKEFLEQLLMTNDSVSLCYKGTTKNVYELKEELNL